MPPQDDGIRSPRKQFHSDLPTPAYNQTGFAQAMPGFQPLAPSSQPIRNTYSPHPQSYTSTGFPTNNISTAPAIYALQPGNGEPYGSLDAISNSSGGSSKKNRRESSMMGINVGLMNQRQPSRQTLRDTSNSRQGVRDTSGNRQQDKAPSFADRDRENPPEQRQQPTMVSQY